MNETSARILILGGTGMLGSVLWSRLRELPGLRVRRTQRHDRNAPGYFDVQLPDAALDEVIGQEGGADLLVNAIGLTQAAIAAAGPRAEEAAEAINTLLPHRLAGAAARAGARLIHVSTDGVFSGRAGPYSERSLPDPDDLYGRSKLSGEPSGRHVLTLRCSLVGPDPAHHRGLLEWFRQLPEGSQVEGFVDQRWNGVTTDQLAELCLALTSHEAFDLVTSRSSLRHLCPNVPVSKFELLCLFQSALGSKVTVVPARSGTPRDRTLTSEWTDLNALLGAPLEMRDAIHSMMSRLSS